MRGRDFLTVAVQLRDIDSEAADRSRTSRAYYGVFLEARAFAETFLNHAPDRSPTTHQSVAAAVASIEPQLKVDFTFLRKARNSADYYESDEPPLRLLFRHNDPAILDSDRYRHFMARLRNESDDGDFEMLAVFPDYAPTSTNDSRRGIEETHVIQYLAESG